MYDPHLALEGLPHGLGAVSHRPLEHGLCTGNHSGDSATVDFET